MSYSTVSADESNEKRAGILIERITYLPVSPLKDERLVGCIHRGLDTGFKDRRRWIVYNGAGNVGRQLRITIRSER